MYILYWIRSTYVHFGCAQLSKFLSPKYIVLPPPTIIKNAKIVKQTYKENKSQTAPPPDLLMCQENWNKILKLWMHRVRLHIFLDFPFTHKWTERSFPNRFKAQPHLFSVYVHLVGQSVTSVCGTLGGVKTLLTFLKSQIYSILSNT
jgi:hypothetical protein